MGFKRTAAGAALSAGLLSTVMAIGASPASAKATAWGCSTRHVCIFEHANGEGYSFSVSGTGAKCVNLGPIGWGDRATSYNKMWTGDSLGLLNWNGASWTQYEYRAPGETGNWNLTAQENDRIDAISIGGSRDCR